MRITNNARSALEKVLKSLEPIDRMYNAAEKFQDFPVFVETPGVIGELNGRHVKVGGNAVETHLKTKIKKHLTTKSPDVTIIVGGPSGSGKTHSVLAQSSKDERTIVAYFLASDEDRIEQVVKNLNPDKRDERVLQWLVDRLHRVLKASGTTVLDAMDKIEPKKIDDQLVGLRFLISFDEMGEWPTVVRALSSLTGTAIKNALAIEYGKPGSFANVDFFTAAVGTGIGSSSADFTEVRFKESIGTMGKLFEYHDPYDTPAANDEKHKAGNLEIFARSFADSKVNVEELKKRMHPTFRAFVEGNARMAAILGKFLMPIKDICDEPEELLAALDLTQVPMPALLEFKEKNGLQRLRWAQLWGLLIKALRMHFFPWAPTVGSKMMEANFGLVLNRWRFEDKCATPPPPGYSQITLPPFTVYLLSMFSGNKVDTQSLVSGAALEDYAFAVLFMIACAACDEELFLTALRYKDGEMMPLHDVRLKEGSGNSASPKFTITPPTCVKKLCCRMRDMARDEPSEGTTSKTDIAGLMKETLPDLEAQRGSRARDTVEYVAAFRSPDKSGFADVFICIGRSLFLIQCKDYADPNEIGDDMVDEERLKMGWFGRWTKKSTSRDTIATIIKNWYATTGLKINKVHRCFVTPSKRTKKASQTAQQSFFVEMVEGSSKVKWEVVLMSDELWVSVDQIRFHSFEKNRTRVPPCSRNRLWGDEISRPKSTQTTPEGASAGEGPQAGPADKRFRSEGCVPQSQLTGASATSRAVPMAQSKTGGDACFQM